MTQCIKKERFEWNEAARKSFETVKKVLRATLILAFPDLSQPFEFECDANRLRVGVVLVQRKRLIAYFSEKFGGGRLN